MEANQGTWTKNPNTAVENFLKADILTTPKYHEDKQLAEDLLQMRKDEKGDIVRRTFLGSSEQFHQAESIMKERRRSKDKKLKKKKSSAFAGLLPNI